MDITSDKIGYFLVFLGASMWGTTGAIGNPLFESSLDTMQIVSAQTSLAASTLIAFLFITKPGLLKVKLSHIPFFIMFGLITQVIYAYSYFNAIRYIGTTVAVILSFTAPIFVCLYARCFLNEKLTKKKISGLTLSIIGCFLTVGGFNIGQYDITPLGIAFGLMTGLSFASYTVMGKIALSNYSSLTVTTYSLCFGAITLSVFYPPVGGYLSDFNTTLWLSILGLGLIPTVLAFIFYTNGLDKIESSKASIISTAEVISTAILAYLVLGEEFTSL